MKILKILLLLICFFYTQVEAENHADIANQIGSEVASHVSKKYGLYLYGAGGSAIHNLRYISQDFMGAIPTEINELRELFIKVATEYNKAFNANREISPYYNTQPFDFRMLELVLQNGNWPEMNDPSKIVYVKSKTSPPSISFYTRTVKAGLNRKFSETIEVALAKVSRETRQKYLEATKPYK